MWVWVCEAAEDMILSAAELVGIEERGLGSPHTVATRPRVMLRANMPALIHKFDEIGSMIEYVFALKWVWYGLVEEGRKGKSGKVKERNEVYP
jgi:hypothetical protein